MKKSRFKTIIFYTFISLICQNKSLSAQSDFFDAHISIFSKNKPLRKVLYEIAQQSNAKFVFSDMLVDGKTINCNIIKLPIDKTLHQIMDQSDISFKIMPGEVIVLFHEKSSGNDVNNNRAIAQFTPIHYTLPTLQDQIEPDYPREARQEGLEGCVEMNLLVNKRGNVEQAKVTQSSGYQILDDAAIEFAKKLKFNPAEKQGKPVNVWVSRVLNYQLVEKYFLPQEYINKIRQLNRLYDKSAREKKSRILQEILNSHQELARYLSSKSTLNYNRYIQEIVNGEVYQQWKDLWNDWPLHFLVFHDFVSRYPKAEVASEAKNSLLYFMKKDIARIRETPQTETNNRLNKDILLKTFYSFLNKEYPEAITEDLRDEAMKYLGER